jgi:hypothetical protein
VQFNTVTTFMDTLTTLPVPSLYECQGCIQALEEHEWKPSVSLVRHGIIPTPRDSIIWSAIPETLITKLFSSTSSEPATLSRLGCIFFGASTRPVISTILISLILAQVPSLEYIEDSKIKSVSKEIKVMESIPEQPSIYWQNLFSHPEASSTLSMTCDPNPLIHKTIFHGLQTLKGEMEFKLLWPYSTRRGVSTDTARRYLGKVYCHGEPWVGENEEHSVISSRDVVGLYLHRGEWIPGYCELKQKWYPSGLTPRTYFAQGGDAILASCYLRDFFNDLCDTFIPTNRYDRVNPNRLITFRDGYFFIYDLTSFTSNFHEQRPFLDALSDFFLGTPVFHVGFNLELSLRDLGEQIRLYCELINTNPSYQLSTKVFEKQELPSLVLKHHVAGFLGVPGNLATCTFAHGTLVAQHSDCTERQSCAGDDGCIAVKDPRHQARIERTIDSLGIFQKEKGYITLDAQAAIYLKRRFVQEGVRGVIIERVEFVMLSVVNAFRKPDPRFPELSEDLPKLRRSVASSVTSLFRSLYQFTNGEYLDGEQSLILSFLHYIYDTVGLPKGGEIRGMVIDDTELRSFVDGTVVFPLKAEFLNDDPDVLFSEQFTPWIVTVPEQTDIEIFDFQGDWSIGTERSCRMNPTVEKLVKYGWVSRKQYPKKVLVGPDARLFFRRLLRDEVESLEYTYTARKDLSTITLQELGIYEYILGTIIRPSKRRKFYHKSIFDPDDPVVLSLNQRYPSDLADPTLLSSGSALEAVELDY